ARQQRGWLVEEPLRLRVDRSIVALLEREQHDISLVDLPRQESLIQQGRKLLRAWIRLQDGVAVHFDRHPFVAVRGAFRSGAVVLYALDAEIRSGAAAANERARRDRLGRFARLVPLPGDSDAQLAQRPVDELDTPLLCRIHPGARPRRHISSL